MKLLTFLSVIILSNHLFSFGQLPEEVALNYLIDSLIGKQLINPGLSNDFYTDPLVPKELLEHGFLTDIHLYSDGYAHCVPESTPNNPYFVDLKEYGLSKEEIERYKRIYKIHYDNYNNESYRDTIELTMPKSIIKIDPYINKGLTQNDKSLFIRVFRSLETDREYFIQLILFAKYEPIYGHKGGFELNFIIDKNDNTISWELGGSFY